MNCNTTHYRANSSSVPGDPTIAVVETPPPKSSLATAELASVEHPIVETIVAPVAGQVSIATTTQAVKAGDTVVTLKAKPLATARTTELEAKLRSLEELAQTEPEAHAEELAKVRGEIAAHQQPVMTWVKATASGVLQLQVALHDEIKRGDPLAVVRDDRLWIGVARFTAEQPTAMWSCAVSSADDARTAACRIQATEVVDGATRVTVEIAATSATSWLRDTTRPRLLLSPR